jgi:hypothetical protein
MIIAKDKSYQRPIMDYLQSAEKQYNLIGKTTNVLTQTTPPMLQS